VLADATAQTALLRITDLVSGSTQLSSLTVAPSSNAPLNAQPATIAFRSTVIGVCANGLSADVIVFGGRPPYAISQPGTFNVSPTVVDRNGGRFTVTARGQCTDGSAIAIVDSSGATVSVNVSSVAPSVVVSEPAFVASPTSVTLDSCATIANIALAGGAGPSSYFAASGDNAVQASVNGTTGVIQRVSKTTTNSSTVNVAFSDGRAVQQVIVTLSLSARGLCP
jgi:hypothetical protein